MGLRCPWVGVPLSALAAGSAQPSPRSLSPLCSLRFCSGCGEAGGEGDAVPPFLPLPSRAPNSWGSWVGLCVAVGSRPALGAEPRGGGGGRGLQPAGSYLGMGGRGLRAGLIPAISACPLPWHQGEFTLRDPELPHHLPARIWGHRCFSAPPRLSRWCGGCRARSELPEAA